MLILLSLAAHTLANSVTLSLAKKPGGKSLVELKAHQHSAVDALSLPL